MTAEQQLDVWRETLEQIVSKTFDPWARAIAEGALALERQHVVKTLKSDR